MEVVLGGVVSSKPDRSERAAAASDLAKRIPELTLNTDTQPEILTVSSDFQLRKMTRIMQFEAK